MTEHRHDFWGSIGRKEADVTRYDFSHPVLLPKAREFPSQGEPAISSRLRQSVRVRRPRPAIEDAELEFSEFGRDGRFLPGWWIIPSVFGWALHSCVRGELACLV